MVLPLDHTGRKTRVMGLNLAERARTGPRARSSRERVGEIFASYDESAVEPVDRVDYGPSRSVDYSLDPLGNRTLETQTVRPASGPNVVTTFSSTFDSFNALKTRSRSGGGLPALNSTFAYDFNGNTLSETTASPAAVTSYTWDRDNRLRAVTPPAPGVPTSYSYDANGLRIERVDASGTVNYLLDGQSVLAELDAANSTATRFLNNAQTIDDIVSFERGGVTYWPLTDALGSIYAVTDGSGAVGHRFDFDVFGMRADLGGAGPTPDAGYTGRWHDANGFIEHRRRERDPRVGSWLQADRIGMLDGPNNYAYARASPVMSRDWSGYRIDQVDSDRLSYSVFLAAIAAPIGWRFYLMLEQFRERIVFRDFPNDWPIADWGARGVTWSSEIESSTCQPTETLFIGLDLTQGGVPIETVVIHEMRHALDYLNGRVSGWRWTLEHEIRAFAAAAIAYEQMTGDMEGFLGSWNYGISYSRFALSLPISYEQLFPNGDREWVQGP